MKKLNLDAARAARREAMGETPSFVFGGREFALPAELPFAVVLDMRELSSADGDTAAQAAAIASVVKHLLGDEHDAFMALSPSIEDLEALIDGVLPEYGTDLPESAASES